MSRSSLWSISRSEAISSSYTGVPEWRYLTSSPRTGRLLVAVVSAEPSHSGGLGRAPDNHAFDAEGLLALSTMGRVLCSEFELVVSRFRECGGDSESSGLRPSNPVTFGNKLILAGAELLVRTCACGGSGKAPIRSAVFAVLLGYVNLF